MQHEIVASVQHYISTGRNQLIPRALIIYKFSRFSLTASRSRDVWAIERCMWKLAALTATGHHGPLQCTARLNHQALFLNLFPHVAHKHIIYSFLD